MAGETEGELRARIAELEQRVAELEYWDAEQIAAYVGWQPRDVPKWCSRHGVKRVTLAKASDVRAAKAAMPGRGSGAGRPFMPPKRKDTA